MTGIIKFLRSIRFIFAWYDFWVGVFYNREKRCAYVFPLPMVGVVIQLPEPAPPPTSKLYDVWFVRPGVRGKGKAHKLLREVLGMTATQAKQAVCDGRVRLLCGVTMDMAETFAPLYKAQSNAEISIEAATGADDSLLDSAQTQAMTSVQYDN